MTELGTVLDGKYEILKKVGQGGMSIVYLAMDNRLNKQWAVKEIKNDGSKSTATLLKSLEREANILKDVDHPVLPRIVDIINENGTIYVVMDFVEGKPLSDVLKAEGAQDQNKVIEWGRALASALDYLHSMNPPIIYRDMKPSNVMLKPDGSVKLIDFGTAKEYIVENNADTTALGTRGYAAPEQFGDSQGRGIYNTDARTDIYNLGATLYHLVTGKNPCEPPYEIKPIRQWNPTLSSGFEQIIIKCCQPSPEDRYQSCSELLYALDHYNELDNEFKAKAKRKVAVFATMAGLSILSGCCAIFGGVKKGQLKEQDYNNKIAEAEDAVDSSDYNKAFECYKAAVDIDPTASEAYIGYMDTYAYYYTDEDAATGTGTETPAEKGIKFALRNIDKVKDDVKYEIALLYFNEVPDYSAARKYFNMVGDTENFANDVKQAKYYEAICDNKINKTADFNDSKQEVFDFQQYNSDNIDDTNTYKYVNYLNIATIYVDKLSSDEELANRTIELLQEASDKLNDNATVLSKEFPEERGVNYYSGQYSAILCSVYTYLAEKESDPVEQVAYYREAINSIDSYLSGLDMNGDAVTEKTKNVYAEYSRKKAEIYVSMGDISGDDKNYELAENVYLSAEQMLGVDDYSADLYTSHLTYLYNRYTDLYGSSPDTWDKSARNTVISVYNSGSRINMLADGKKPQWNTLIHKPVIEAIVSGTGSKTGK